MATSTPDNVIMTADGPRLIDWIGAVRRARRLRPCDLPYPSDRARPESRRRSGTTARRQCGRAVRVRATGMPHAALGAAIGPSLPIVRLRVLFGPAGSAALRERLIQRIEAALRPED